MKLSAMGARDLQNEINRYNGSTLGEALDEIERLRTICQDIIEIIGVDYAQGAEPNFCLYQIAEICPPVLQTLRNLTCITVKLYTR